MSKQRIGMVAEILPDYAEPHKTAQTDKCMSVFAANYTNRRLMTLSVTLPLRRASWHAPMGADMEALKRSVNL
jgi:hypothetical protein